MIILVYLGHGMFSSFRYVVAVLFLSLKQCLGEVLSLLK